MLGWAITLLHLNKSEFGELRVPEYWAAIDAYADEKEADRIHVGELARGAALRLWNLQVSKKDRIEDPSKFWPMPWDKPDSLEEAAKNIMALDDKDRDKLAQDFLKRLGHTNGK